MKKIKEFFGTFVKRCREEKSYRYAVIVITLSIAAFAVNEWREWEDSKAVSPTAAVEEQTESEEMDFLQEVWNDSKLHFFVFGGLAAALGIVKWRNSVKLKESGQSIKK